MRETHQGFLVYVLGKAVESVYLRGRSQKMYQTKPSGQISE